MLRRTYRLRKGKILEVEEYHQGNYGAPGKSRSIKENLTKEQMKIVNRMNKKKQCRLRLLEYFDDGDMFATWTYNPEERPPDMNGALKDFQKAMRKVRAEYKKRGRELFWIRNIERGTKGAWHIHLVVNEIGGTASILQRAWKKGGTWNSEIRHNDKIYDEDFSKLASYITKTAGVGEKKKDGTVIQTQIKEENYGISRNMPIPEPTKKELARWKKEPKPVKGYYIAKLHEGTNPFTGYPYRHYTMIRLNDKQKEHTARTGSRRHIQREDRQKKNNESKRKKGDMGKIKGNYYCFSFDRYNHELYSVNSMKRREAIRYAIKTGTRLYIVEYRNGEQYGRKQRISLKGKANKC